VGVDTGVEQHLLGEGAGAPVGQLVAFVGVGARVVF
jgi:hypothetical protein